MASRKQELIKEAKKLKLDTSGTIADLEERIEAEYAAREKAAKAKARAEAKAKKEAEAKKAEAKAKAKAKREAKKAEVKEAVKKEIPRATPIAAVAEQETATAKKTTVKFVGGWRHLKKGKTITAPKNVIAILRQNDLVE